jgi:hypothetical protein
MKKFTLNIVKDFTKLPKLPVLPNLPNLPRTNKIDAITMSYISNIEFNKTYYKLVNNKLIAFRILAMAKIEDKWSYLVQIPNKPLEWVKDFLTICSIIFENKEDFLVYLQTNEKTFNLEESNLMYDLHNVYKYLNWTKTYLLGWEYKNDKFEPHCLPIDCLLIINNQVYVYTNTPYAINREDCFKSIIESVTIEDFAEDVIEIQVLPNTGKTYTMKVIW